MNKNKTMLTDKKQVDKDNDNNKQADNNDKVKDKADKENNVGFINTTLI